MQLSKCRKLSGSLHLGVIFSEENFLVDGELSSYEYVGGSGNKVNSKFCGNCGTKIYSKAELFEGLVSVAYKDTLVKVPAGNYLVIKENQFVSYSSIQTQAPSWIDFESSFENSDLSMVLEELKRQFPVTIDNQIELEKKFTGSFTHKDLNVALRSICEPLQLQFTVKDNVVTIYAENSR